MSLFITSKHYHDPIADITKHGPDPDPIVEDPRGPGIGVIPDLNQEYDNDQARIDVPGC